MDESADVVSSVIRRDAFFSLTPIGSKLSVSLSNLSPMLPSSPSNRFLTIWNEILNFISALMLMLVSITWTYLTWLVLPPDSATLSCCSIITLSASCVALAEPNMDEILSGSLLSSFLGCITIVMCTLKLVANRLNAPIIWSCWENLQFNYSIIDFYRSVSNLLVHRAKHGSNHELKIVDDDVLNIMSDHRVCHGLYNIYQYKIIYVSIKIYFDNILQRLLAMKAHKIHGQVGEFVGHKLKQLYILG